MIDIKWLKENKQPSQQLVNELIYLLNKYEYPLDNEEQLYDLVSSIRNKFPSRQKLEDNVSEITLLSIGEYKRYRDNIPLLREWWWLRSPGNYSYRAARVDYEGGVDSSGIRVDDDGNAVRPALKITNLKFFGLKTGDEVSLVGHTWTVIRDDLLLMNDTIGNYCFRKDYKASDANNYEKSDIKKYIEDWAHQKGLI